MDSQGRAKRSLKYFQAGHLGSWIVTLRWVEESKHAGHWLRFEPFEVAGDTAAVGWPRTSKPHSTAVWRDHTCKVFWDLLQCV